MTVRKRIAVALYLVSAAWAIGRPAQGNASPITYKATDLGALVGRNSSLPYSLNNAGQVLVRAGNYDTHGHAADGIAFVYNSVNGSITPTFSGPVAINDSGALLVGQGTAFNNAGQIVGSNLDSHAFLRTGTQTLDLGALAPHANSEAYSVNATGQVAGYSEVASGSEHPFLYKDGHMIDLGLLPYTQGARAFAINDKGQIVGGRGNQTSHPFLYDGGKLIDLGTLGGSKGAALGLNDLGQIVGTSDVLNSSFEHAFLYQDGKLVDLNDILSLDGGLVLDVAIGVNDRGQILADARNADGISHAFLLSPTTVPEPTTLQLSLVCVAFVVARSLVRRR